MAKTVTMDEGGSRRRVHLCACGERECQGETDMLNPGLEISIAADGSVAFMVA